MGQNKGIFNLSLTDFYSGPNSDPDPDPGPHARANGGGFH
jgi:hypothetical protein